MTIKELAQLAGVSVSTVSKIMNQKDASISAETRELVIRLAKEYNYRPYSSFNFQQSRSMTIGVLLRNASELDLTFSGILSRAGSRGYSVLVRDSDSSSAESEQRNLTAFAEAHVDGLIWEPVSQESLPLTKQLEKADIPYVLGNTFLPSAQPSYPQSDAASLVSQTSFPYLDFEDMGYFVTEALVKKGHKAIACLLIDGTRADSFYKGYQRCLFDHHIGLNEEFVFHFADGLPTNQLAAHSFSGIVSSHYTAALKLYQTMDFLHRSIPYDLSIVSLRNDARFQTDYPPISTLTIPHLAYGERLADTLIDIIEKKELQPAPKNSFVLDNEQSIDIPFHSRTKKVLSIGCVNIDHYINFEELPRSGKTVTSDTSSVYLGGRCANAAVGLAKLGHSVSIIGRVGNDPDADFVYSSLSAFPLIDAHALQRTQSAKTGRAFIFVQRDGESMISVLAEANRALSPQDILDNESLFSNCGYCLLQMGVPINATIKAAETAKKHGVITVLKPSSCTGISTKLLQHTDIIVPNDDELGDICRGLCPENASLEQKAEFLIQCGVKLVIVTMGSQGCYIRYKTEEYRLPAASFVSTDTSSASDAFISAFVSYLLDGYDMLSSARIATYAAGMSTTKQGCSSSLVDRATLENHILRVEPDLLTTPVLTGKSKIEL